MDERDWSKWTNPVPNDGWGHGKANIKPLLPEPAIEHTDDLRYRDLTEQVLFHVDLRGKKLYGAKISLKCETFDGLKLDPTQMSMLLLMISLADMSTTAWRDGLLNLIESEIGAQELKTLKRYLQLA
jgi:hypothetical protein